MNHYEEAIIASEDITVTYDVPWSPLNQHLIDMVSNREVLVEIEKLDEAVYQTYLKNTNGNKNSSNHNLSTSTECRTEDGAQNAKKRIRVCIYDSDDEPLPDLHNENVGLCVRVPLHLQTFALGLPLRA